MTIADEVKKVMDDMTNDGTIENIIRSQMETQIQHTIEDSFKWGDIHKTLKSRIEDTMIPYIEQYDFSKYLIKLDTVLTDIVNNTTLTDNQTLLKNFSVLMTEPDTKDINMSAIFKAYKDYVAKYCDTYDLEAHDDGDGPYYDAVIASATIEYDKDRPWSSFDRATLEFSVENQPDLSKTIRIEHYKNDGKEWRISNRDYKGCGDIRSLQYLSDFDCLLERLHRSHTNILLDEDEFEEEVTPDETPEYSLS